MNRVYMAELTCPNQHTVTAGVGEYNNTEGDEMPPEEAVQKAFRELARESLGPGTRCGICHAPVALRIIFTHFKTIDEACSAMIELRRKERLAAALLASRN